MSVVLAEPSAFTTPHTRDIRSTTLPNGLLVLTERMPHLRSVSMGVWLRSGSRDETPETNGISHFLEHMVFKGSEQLAAGEFDLKVEALGGNSNAATGFDDVHYHVLMPPEAAPEALDLLLARASIA